VKPGARGRLVAMGALYATAWQSCVSSGMPKDIGGSIGVAMMVAATLMGLAGLTMLLCAGVVGDDE